MAPQAKRGFWVGVAVAFLRPSLMALTRREWSGQEKLPQTGGVVLVGNHTSYVDPLVVAHFVYDNGRIPRFLAKSGLFKLPLAGRVLHGAGQIPVYRESRDAALAFTAAVDAVNRGECVVVYPEGTTTQDPDLWPMVAKTGAARIALATGAPVYPIAEWGAAKILPPHGKLPRIFPRKRIQIRLCDPVDLSDVVDKPVTGDLLREVTARFMQILTAEVAKLRGETPPAQMYDPRPPRRAAAEGSAASTPADGQA